MQGEVIDDYIAKFENLVRKAGIPRTEQGVLDRFRDGLKRGLHAAILRRDKWPTTLDQWQEQARREIRRFAIMKEALGGGTNPSISTRQAKWKDLAQQALQKIKRNDVVPMDVDAGQIDEEAAGCKSDPIKEKLCRERRCFECRQQGHIAIRCPDRPNKPKPPRKPTTSKPTSSRAAVPKEEEDDILTTRNRLRAQMTALPQEQKEALFQDFLNSPEGF
jgi:hypothetical protein